MCCVVLQLLTWSSYTPYNFSGPHGYTLTATLDLTNPMATVPIVNVSNTGHDMFCPGGHPNPDP